MSIISVIMPIEVSALSGSQFRAGRIVDDSIFYNGNAMSAAEIQAFLNAKVPSCDANGTKASSHYYSAAGRYYTRAEWGAINSNPAPYTCLRDYQQSTVTKIADAYCTGYYSGGTKSAARIIYDVAKACGVSQKALLVLLQKEQSLITDDWPWDIQYRSATGYGCPDTAPCDAEYYGFFNQVYNAARQFRRYSVQSQLFNYRAGQSNYIQYNPNAGCGGSNVFIENDATAALYNYTPYQPNASSLNNLYGSGDGCGAYGNRNFWRMYNDWFGPTIGSLVKTSNSSTVYFLDNGKAHVVSSLSLLKDLAAFGPVRVTTASEINQYSSTKPFSRLVGGESSTLYFVNASIRLRLPSCSMVVDYGFDCSASSITYLSEGALRVLRNGPQLTNLYRSNTNYTAYWMDRGKKRPITSLGDLKRIGGSTNVLSSGYVDSVRTGLAVYGPGSLVKTANSSTVYVVKDIKTLLPVKSFVHLQEIGLDAKVRTISSSYTVASTLTTYITCNGKKYVGTKGGLYETSTDIITHYDLSNVTFVEGGNICNFLNISQVPLGQYIRVNNTIFLVSGGIKRAFSSYSVYQGPSYCNNVCSYIDTSEYLAATIGNGPNI